VLTRVGDGHAAVYRFGCVLFFDADEESARGFLTELGPRVGSAFEKPVEEAAEFSIDPDGSAGLHGGGIVLGNRARETLMILGDVLAKSVALEYYEQRISETFDRVEPLTAQLAKTGKIGRRAKVLVQHIASVMLAEHRLLGRIEVVDKPELLWDKPELERLHAWLVDEYEIKERHVALERKLSLLSNTAQTLLNLLQSSRSLRVEWYIVLLIVLEVVLMLFYERYAWPWKSSTDCASIARRFCACSAMASPPGSSCLQRRWPCIRGAWTIERCSRRRSRWSWRRRTSR
jgi:uncharacterized Rmd1/YagE family protein